MNPILHPRISVAAAGTGCSYIIFIDLLLARGPGDIDRLVDDVLDQLKSRGEFFPVKGEPRSVSQQIADRVRRTCDRAMFVGKPLQQARVACDVIGRDIHLAIDFGLHLEVGLEVRVDGKEGVVPTRIPHDDDFDIERHRRGFRCSRNRHAGRAVLLFQTDHPVPQGTLELIPADRVGPQGLGPQHEDAAIGTVEGAGLNHREICLQRPTHLLVLDAPKEVLIGWIALQNDRGATDIGIVDEQVDRIAGFRGWTDLRWRARRLRGLLVTRVKQGDVLNHIDAKSDQPAVETLMVLEPLSQCID